jgi:hypothetical protein
MRTATYGVEVETEHGDQPCIRIKSGMGDEVVISPREVDSFIEILKEAKAEFTEGE